MSADGYRAARTHTDAAAVGSGDPDGHRTEAEAPLLAAGKDDARAADLERGGWSG